MTDFGYNTIGVGGSDNPSNNWVWLKATSTPASNGTLTSIQAYCQLKGGQSGGGSTVDFALYSNSGSAPGSLLQAGSTPVAAPASFGWTSQTGFSLSISAGVQYWFAIRCPNVNGVNNDASVDFDTNGGLTEGFFLSAGTPPIGAFPASAAGATGFTNERWSIYGTYTPAVSAPVGRLEEPMQNTFGLVVMTAVRNAAYC